MIGGKYTSCVYGNRTEKGKESHWQSESKKSHGGKRIG